LSDANGCLSALLTGGNDQQTINALDTITTQIALSCIFPLCAGDSTGQMNMTWSSYDTLYTYNWINTADPTTSLGDGYSIDLLPAGTYVLHANYLGCQDSDTMVVIAPDPIQISGSVTNAICYGDNNGSIDATIIGGTVSPSIGYSLLWSNNATTEDITNLGDGFYVLSATDSWGCESSLTFEVTQPAELVVTIVESSPFVLELSSVTGGVPLYTYAWWQNQPGANQQVGTGTSYIVSGFGTYYLEVTDDHNCVAQSNSETYVPSAIVDGQQISLKVYPNPFREEATIDFGYVVNEATLSIVDIYGKLIEQHEISNSESFVITSKNKASGIYFLKMETSDELFTFKIVID
jgi:hypothetical protein